MCVIFENICGAFLKFSEYIFVFSMCVRALNFENKSVTFFSGFLNNNECVPYVSRISVRIQILKFEYIFVNVSQIF